jgi:hypothetical protein
MPRARNHEAGAIAAMQSSWACIHLKSRMITAVMYGL